MYQESTELRWIGCLTESIWTPRFRLGTLTPNINSQTYWTKGNVTRDEWNILLHLFNISHLSSLCCAKNSSLMSCTKKMTKRVQEQKEEERVVSKSRPTAMNLAISVSTSSSSVNSPIASRSLEVLKAPSRHIGFSGRLGVSANQNANPDGVSSSQGW